MKGTALGRRASGAVNNKVGMAGEGGVRRREPVNKKVGMGGEGGAG